MGFIAAGHQNWKCKMVMMIQRKCKMQNSDDDTKIWSSFVAFLMSSLLILPFQVECTYVLLSSIRVNVFHFHVACNHCSSTCFLDHICDTVTVFKHQTPRPVKAANWWGTSPPQGSLSFLILRYPNLEKTPNLNRFYKKRKNWVYLIKNWNDMFGNWSISTRDLLPSKIMNFKKIHTFHKTTSFTQLNSILRPW